MELDRDDARGARRHLEHDGGLVLRSTRRGALVFRTDNARRMMRSLRELPQGLAEAGPSADRQAGRRSRGVDEHHPRVARRAASYACRAMKEELRPALKAAAITAFVVGTVMVFLNPPSLSGAPGLLALIVAALALVLVTAWITVGLMGRDVMSEEEFEQVVRRTEELARQPELAQQATEFELLVADAIDDLPEEFRELLERTPVVVSQRGARSAPTATTSATPSRGGHYEDRIVIYQDTLERDFGHDPDLLRAQVERTLRHEAGAPPGLERVRRARARALAAATLQHAWRGVRVA